MMLIVEHYCKGGCKALAKDNPADRPVCHKHRRAMKPAVTKLGTAQVLARRVK